MHTHKLDIDKYASYSLVYLTNTAIHHLKQ